MTAAAHDTLRRVLGLSVDETAALHGVQDARTVRRWHDGTRALPDDAMPRLEGLREAMEDEVEQILRTAQGRTVLTRYRSAANLAPHSDLPPGAHAMMIGWAADALRDQGATVEIVWG